MRVTVYSDVVEGTPALEALELLGHEISYVDSQQPSPAATISRVSGTLSRPDVVVVDARQALVIARNLLVQLASVGEGARLVVVSEAGFAALNPSWPAHEVILDSAGPAEVDARIRLAMGRASEEFSEPAESLEHSGLEIDEDAYSARVQGRVLNLTYKEFELLKFLAASPDRVFTRDQLLHEVWGYDYFGGTRTVDVHIRRLRSKLGADHEALIATVRNVGYLFSTGRGSEEV